LGFAGYGNARALCQESRAVAKPMPLFPPVISAILFRSFMRILTL
jgi:hypothetical protein